MIIEILTHTPTWVWLILALLVYRGLLASRDREMPLQQMFIVPAIFLWLALDGIARNFGWHALHLLAWMLGAGISIGIAWLSFDPQRMQLRADGRTVFVRGSWIPLLLMMVIFLIKYATGVLLVMQPARAQDSGFAVTVCLLYGVCNGLFLARVLRVLVLRQRSSG